MKKHPIFLVGLPRSGSTLWLNILKKNPQLMGINEINYLNPWHRDFRYFIKKYVKDLSSNGNIKKMIKILFSNRKVVGLNGDLWLELKQINDIHLKEILYNRIAHSDRSLGNIFKILVEELARFKGYSRCVIKFPLYINHINKLIKWYPQCKIVHMTRDPRAIALSKTNDPGGIAVQIKKYPLTTFFTRKMMILFVILQFLWSSKIHIKYQHLDNYLLLRYEDLLTNPEKVIKKLCGFSETDYLQEMLHPDKGQASSLTGKKNSGFDKSASYRWKQYITRFENKLITLLLNKSKKRMGY